MSKPIKIIIEADEEEATITIELHGKLVALLGWEKVPGGARSNQKQDYYDVLPNNPELAETLDDRLAFLPMELMNACWDIEPELQGSNKE